MKVKVVNAGILFEEKLNKAILELENDGKTIFSLHTSDDLSVWVIIYKD